MNVCLFTIYGVIGCIENGTPSTVYYLQKSKGHTHRYNIEKSAQISDMLSF